MQTWCRYFYTDRSLCALLVNTAVSGLPLACLRYEGPGMIVWISYKLTKNKTLNLEGVGLWISLGRAPLCSFYIKHVEKVGYFPLPNPLRCSRNNIGVDALKTEDVQQSSHLCFESSVQALSLLLASHPCCATPLLFRPTLILTLLRHIPSPSTYPSPSLPSPTSLPLQAHPPSAPCPLSPPHPRAIIQQNKYDEEKTWTRWA